MSDNQGLFSFSSPCPVCGGRGVTIDDPCRTCRGSGVERRPREVKVRIPAGVADGQRIRLSGEGHAGEPGGGAGDAYVLVHVRPDERFVREGDDIVSQVDLTMTQAAIGATVPVDTLDGEVELEFKPGTQPGEVVVLRGKGMPSLRGRGRGNQRVLVNVLIPRRLTDEQRRMLEEFERGTDAATYEGEHSLFDRIRAAFR